jgi:hypothetical protein
LKSLVLYGNGLTLSRTGCSPGRGTLHSFRPESFRRFVLEVDERLVKTDGTTPEAV